MDQYAWKGAKGYYWITFDDHPNGGRVAQASGPIQAPGPASSIGRVASKTADTDEEAHQLLLAELQRRGA